MNMLARATAPLVWLLDRSSALIFHLLGMRRESENHVTAEELHLIVAEAQSAGVIDESERAMISSVMRLADRPVRGLMTRSEEHTSELQSLMRISYAVFCLKKKTQNQQRKIKNI